MGLTKNDRRWASAIKGEAIKGEAIKGEAQVSQVVFRETTTHSIYPRTHPGIDPGNCGRQNPADRYEAGRID